MENWLKCQISTLVKYRQNQTYEHDMGNSFTIRLLRLEHLAIVDLNTGLCICF